MDTAFLEKYSAAADSLEETVSRRKKAGVLSALGYASNLDLLCSFRPEELSRFITAKLAGSDPDEAKPSGKITTAKALAETILYYCRNGLGGEADIENTEALAGIVGMEKAIGGTGVQASLALASVGSDALAHLTDASEEVLQLLSVPGIYAAAS
ncbi:MAG: ADP-dependent glucokinase, partial [Lachnospiraceae bacterium]|nr:ADP-dependent glucokinase [Lachnospiraceae bacterium]